MMSKKKAMKKIDPRDPSIGNYRRKLGKKVEVKFVKELCRYPPKEWEEYV